MSNQHLNPTTRITAYISQQPPFARPILKHLRTVIRHADPAMVESWTWGPAFEQQGLVCGIFGFKRWVSIWFYKGAAILDRHHLFTTGLTNRNMRSIRFTSLAQVKLCQRHLVEYIRQAVKNNIRGVKAAAPRRRTAEPMPADLRRLLAQRGLSPAYAARPPYQQRDYVSWISRAKQATTREKRISQMLEELEDGRRYMGMKYTFRS